ncbi:MULTISPECIES: hypothetical protein [Limnospira]|uniref:Uncharacterized protein n=1 Tax=Limnospira fusiformis PMC 851.14 TaxID=2219512 RepID=A0ABU9ELC0_LIMFS|nr:hypothetical protein [Limnospira maxima]
MVGSGRVGGRFLHTPSVPRFNPGVMIPQTGGGYRRYPLLCDFSVRLGPWVPCLA